MFVRCHAPKGWKWQHQHKNISFYFNCRLVSKWSLLVYRQRISAWSASIESKSFIWDVWCAKTNSLSWRRSKFRLVSERYNIIFLDWQHTIHIVNAPTAVDAFQGSEKEIIFLSTCRTSARRLGFLSSPQRLNVSITRARRHIILVGMSRVLQASKLWRTVIGSCSQITPQHFSPNESWFF